MNKLVQSLQNQSVEKLTENGAIALSSTMDDLVDAFATIGALRSRPQDVRHIFAKAFAQDKLLATKLAFYTRNIRGGLGERKTFRLILEYLCDVAPQIVEKNIEHIATFGRWDDVVYLINTPCEKIALNTIKMQFEKDLVDMKNNKSISLLAKWLPSASTCTSYKNKIKELKAYINSLKTHEINTYIEKFKYIYGPNAIDYTNPAKGDQIKVHLKLSNSKYNAMMKEMHNIVNKENELIELKKNKPSNVLLANKIAKYLGLSQEQYRKSLSKMRKYIDVVEVKMSAKQFGEINYEGVPSKAMSNYRNAFQRNDMDRFNDYIDSVSTGQSKINSSTQYPYDLLEKINLNYGGWSSRNLNCNFDKVIEEQWKSLPNYIEEGKNILVMADTSGSMSGRPLATSVGLAIYFAERNIGDFKNVFMTFSSKPSFVTLKGNTLQDKIKCIPSIVENTNLQKAFELILDTAVKNKLPQSEMPVSLVVISDMEFDRAQDDSHFRLFYDKLKNKFELAGYTIPNVVFWNVYSRQNTFHVNHNCKGVQLLSGQSISTFKTLLQTINCTPYEAMLKALNDPMYDCITI